jgi:hypothetical protein
MKNLATIALTLAMLTVIAHADFIATIKCDARAWPTETFQSVGLTYVPAIKRVIQAAEQRWAEDASECHSLRVVTREFDLPTEFDPHINKFPQRAK